MAISIAMAMQRYDAGRIARQSTSRASLEATRCHHRSSARIISPRRPPWSTNSLKQHKTLTKHNYQLATTVHFKRQLFVSISHPKTDPLLTHRCRKLRKIVTLHDESGRAKLTFQLSNANNGQKLLKLPIPKEACQKVGAHECQQLLFCFYINYYYVIQLWQWEKMNRRQQKMHIFPPQNKGQA